MEVDTSRRVKRLEDSMLFKKHNQTPLNKISSAWIIQQSYSSLLGLEWRPNATEGAAESDQSPKAPGQGGISQQSRYLSVEGLNLKHLKRSRRSAPFAIQKRPTSSYNSHELHCIEQSPCSSNHSDFRLETDLNDSPVDLNVSSLTLNASCDSFEEHLDHSVCRYEREDDDFEIDLGFNSTAHHFPDFDDENGSCRDERLRIPERNENFGVTLRINTGNRESKQKFVRNDVTRKSFPLYDKRRLVHVSNPGGSKNISGADAKSNQRTPKLKSRSKGREVVSFIDKMAIHTCMAIWDHVTCDPEELQFKCGDLIEILDKSDCNWWKGRLDDQEGWFPNIFVQDVRETFEMESQDEKSNEIRKFHKRALCVRELVYSERNYVRNLKNILEIYREAFKKSRAVKQQEVDTIFNNIPQIYELHLEVVSKLENCAIDKSKPDSRFHEWCVSSVFIGSIRQFVDVYATYCNGYQAATTCLKSLQRKKTINLLIEKCKNKHGETLSLQHFLLTPIQRICRYQMQLAELIKNTPETHPDYLDLKEATEEMRRAAFEINERRRTQEVCREANHSTCSSSQATGSNTASFDEKPKEQILKRVPSKGYHKRLLKLFSYPNL